MLQKRIKFGQLQLKYINQLIFNRKTSFSDQKSKFEQLNSQYKEFLKQTRYNIRKPYEQNHFVSLEQREKEIKDSQKELKNYLRSYRLNPLIDEIKFIQLLSKLSYTIDNREIVQSQEFTNLVTLTAERCNEFFSFHNFLLFVQFCSIQNFEVEETVWGNFNSYIMNNYKNQNFPDKINLLKFINNKNWDEFNIFFELFENSFLQDVGKINSSAKYSYILEILNVYTQYQQGTPSFIFTLNSIIKENIGELSIQHTILLIQYYSNSQELLEEKNQMLDNLEERVTKLIVFLNPKEIITVLYCYIKLGRGSEKLFVMLQDRVGQVVEQMSIDDIKRMLTIISNRQTSIKPIFDTVEAHIRKNFKILKREDLSNLFYSFCENNQGSEWFYTFMESKLIENIFQMSNQLIADCLWGAAVSQLLKQKVFFQKAEEAIVDKLESFTVRQLATIIWSFCYKKLGSEILFKKIEDDLSKRDLNTKECIQLLWAYVQNRPLQKRTVDRFREIILKNKDQLDNWDISTLLWSFTKFQQYDIQEIYQGLEERLLDLAEEMSPDELILSLRAYIETKNETSQIVMKVAYNLDSYLSQLSYDQVLYLIFAFSSTTNVPISPELSQFLTKLALREEELKELMREKQQIEVKK